MSSIRDTDGLSAIGAISARDAANVLSEIGLMAVRTVDGLFEVFSSASSPFSVDVTPDSYGARVSDYPGPVVTSEVVATPTGGKAPYTYLWQPTGAPVAGWSIISPTSQATTFRLATVAPGDSESTTFNCTVTDANGAAVVSADVTATATAYGTGGIIP